MMGYNPHADWTNKPPPVPQVTKWLEQFWEAQCHTQELMIKAQQSWVKHKDMPKYWVGDQVWLEGKHLRTHQPTHKLAARHHGPFTIQEVLSPINYHLELPHQWCIHPVFHIDLLTPYQETPMHGTNYQCPPPDLVDGEEEYEIEKVIDFQCFGQRKAPQYLVKWKGYPDLENQWVNWQDMNANEAIREYEDQIGSWDGPRVMRDKRRTQSQGMSSSSPSCIHMSSTDSMLNSPLINNIVDLTIQDDATPITKQELQQVLHHFPLNPEPARLSPNAHGLTITANPLSTSQLSIRFNPTPDPDNNWEYYILHANDTPCTQLTPELQYFGDSTHMQTGMAWSGAGNIQHSRTQD